MSHSKIDQIVRLREMLKKWRKRALKKAHSFSDVRSEKGRGRVGESGGGGGSIRRSTRRSLSMPTGGEGKGRVPAGHLAVYVGEERKRFVIKMSYLSHPLFKALLKKTEEEMGFHQEGALAIPCQVPFFEHLLLLIDPCKSHHHSNIMSILHISHPHPHLEEDYPLTQHQELFHELLGFSSTPCPLPHSLSSLNVSSLLGTSQA